MPLQGPGGPTPRPLPAPATPPAPKGLPGGRAEISEPRDPVQLAPGPNQLARVLDHAPARLKAEMLHLQNRPGAFHEGAQHTRILHGKEVTISAPILGMKAPKETGKAGRTGDPGALVKQETASAERPALARPGRLAIEAPPPKAHSGEVEAARPQGGPPQIPAPAGPQTAAGTLRPTAPGGPARTQPGEGNLPDTPAGPEGAKQGMGWGKKALIGMAALIGLSFLIPQDSSSSSSDPDGKAGGA